MVNPHNQAPQTGSRDGIPDPGGLPSYLFHPLEFATNVASGAVVADLSGVGAFPQMAAAGFATALLFPLVPDAAHASPWLRAWVSRNPRIAFCSAYAVSRASSLGRLPSTLFGFAAMALATMLIMPSVKPRIFFQRRYFELPGGRLMKDFPYWGIH